MISEKPPGKAHIRFSLLDLNIFDDFHQIVFAMAVVALSFGMHSRRFCRPLSALVAFVICDGCLGDKIVVGLSAWFFPAFPKRSAEPEDEDMDLARALSASLAGMRKEVADELASDSDAPEDFDADLAWAISASLAAMEGDVEAEPDSLATARASLPAWARIWNVPPSGWCFFSCVLHFLQLPEDFHVDEFLLAAIMLENLGRHRSDFEQVVAPSEEEEAEAQEEVLSIPLYNSVSDQLQAFDFYVLDKLEAAWQEYSVLDARLYVDYPEITALLRTCRLSFLRTRPPTTWTETSVGSYFDEDGGFTDVASSEALRSMLK